MRKRNIFGIIGAGMAMAMAGTVATSSVAEPVPQQQQTTQQQPIAEGRELVRLKRSLSFKIGGVSVTGYRQGIPPKVYGTYYVRRGTHKFSNKKR